jgi:hypothetical protein
MSKMSPQRPGRSDSPFQKSASSMFGQGTPTDYLKPKVRNTHPQRFRLVDLQKTKLGLWAYPVARSKVQKREGKIT